MCPYHWKMLPPITRDRIQGFWRAIKDCQPEKLAQVLDDYRLAVEEAANDVARREAHLTDTVG